MGDQPTIKIESATQLAVFLSNRPGALARVCEELAGAKINIHALSISDTADHSVVRMVVSDPQSAHAPGRTRSAGVGNGSINDRDRKPSGRAWPNCGASRGGRGKYRIRLHGCDVEFA